MKILKLKWQFFFFYWWAFSIALGYLKKITIIHRNSSEFVVVGISDKVSSIRRLFWVSHMNTINTCIHFFNLYNTLSFNISSISMVVIKIILYTNSNIKCKVINRVPTLILCNLEKGTTILFSNIIKNVFYPINNFHILSLSFQFLRMQMTI